MRLRNIARVKLVPVLCTVYTVLCTVYCVLCGCVHNCVPVLGVCMYYSVMLLINYPHILLIKHQRIYCRQLPSTDQPPLLPSPGPREGVQCGGEGGGV